MVSEISLPRLDTCRSVSQSGTPIPCLATVDPRTRSTFAATKFLNLHSTVSSDLQLLMVTVSGDVNASFLTGLDQGGALFDLYGFAIDFELDLSSPGGG